MIFNLDKVDGKFPFESPWTKFPSLFIHGCCGYACLDLSIVIALNQVYFFVKFPISGVPKMWWGSNRGNIWSQKMNIACQDHARAKGFGMKKKSVPRIQSSRYGLKCCIDFLKCRYKEGFPDVTISRRLSPVLQASLARLGPWPPWTPYLNIIFNS